jgi:hypothetical protein
MFPDYDPLIMDLIPYTNGRYRRLAYSAVLTFHKVGGWSHGQASNSKFFWKADIYSMARKLGEYQKDVQLRKLGAKEALEHFKKTRRALVEDIMKVSIDSKMKILVSNHHPVH